MPSKHNISHDSAAPQKPELRLRALETFLIENGHVEPPVLNALVTAFGNRIDPNASPGVAIGGQPDQSPAQVGAEAMLAIPRDPLGPVFRERWEGLAFSLALALAGRGTFDWPEWAELFGQEIIDARGDDDRGAHYYGYWVATLEQIVAQKGLAARAD
jgi:nitrile hydratase accessory protein